MTIEPIGSVRSTAGENVDSEWGGVVAEIVVREEWSAGLLGLDAFSHVVVVFYMDRATFDRDSDLVRRPRGRADMPEVGIFAQRAKHRPNPIGVSIVELLSLQGNVLRVRGLDAIDGTPVLDIKPYFSQFDHVEGAVMPEWVDRLMEGYF
ncbi:MAG: tRNA (N6-threonylcarbamoyladenosine(37)-N6)-methyltransferase TrmO [Chloroflexota bacterium]